MWMQIGSFVVDDSDVYGDYHHVCVTNVDDDN